MGVRFHLPKLDPSACVDGDGFHYLARVLRLRSGDRLVVFDGAGHEADAEVMVIGDSSLDLRCGALRLAPAARTRVTLLVAILKGDKTDLVVQKATEIGAARIVPLQTARTVVKLHGDRANARATRWQTIAEEAARQCGRSDVPVVRPLQTLAEALRDAVQETTETLRLVLYEGESERKLGAAIPRPATDVALLVGPEGGFESNEIEMARAAGFVPVSLGIRLLRAETAAIAGLAVVQHCLGELG